MAKCPSCGSEYSEGRKLCKECGDLLDNYRGWYDSIIERSQSPGITSLPLLIGAKAVGLGLWLDHSRRYWPLWAAGVLFLVVQWEFPLVDWWKSWNKEYSYYSHGPLVPLIAAFMVWANRKRIARVKIQPSWLGLVLFVPSIVLFIFGRWTGSGFWFCGTAFFGFLLGAMLMLLGTRMTRVMLFPLLFLSAMLPAPSTVLDNATLKIQLQSTTVAANMLRLTYDGVRQNGATIEADGVLPEPLVVGTPCSGFRLLISLLTFTAFFVYMIQAPFWKKALLVIATFPLSLFINALRIAMIGYAGIWTQSGEAMHKFHDYSGYIGLVICFAILFGIARLIRANQFGIPDPPVIPIEGDQGDGPKPHRLVGRGGRGAAVLALFGLVLLTNILIPPLETTQKGSIAPGHVPGSFGEWIAQDLPIDPIVSKELKTADIMSRIYTNFDLSGREVQVFVEAAKDTDAFHDPHSCLPGGGTPITKDRVIEIAVNKPRPMRIRATLLEASSEQGSGLVLYWYMSGVQSCPSTSDVRRIMRFAQISDFWQLATNFAKRDEIRQRIANRQWYWYRFSTDVWEGDGQDLQVLKRFVREFIAHSQGFGQ